MPRVTMVVAAWQCPEQLTATVWCLLAQTVQDIEIIVVHDGKGPEVKAAVERIGDKRVLYRQTRRWNKDWGNSSKELGSNIARGEFIGHSNDDNYYAPVYLERMLAALESNRADFAYRNMVHSHQQYMPFDTRPCIGWMDGGGWLCRASIVRSTPWPEPKNDSYADGKYVEALVQRCNGVVKVPGYLFVHN